MNEQDWLSLEEIPYYEQQLSNAYAKLCELQNLLIDDEETYEDSIVVSHQEGRMSAYQIYSDLPERNKDLIFLDMAEKLQSEVDNIEEENQQLSQQIQEYHNDLDQLHDQLIQVNQQNDVLQQDVKQTEALIFLLQQKYTEIQQQLIDQNFYNDRLTQQVEKQKASLQSQEEVQQIQLAKELVQKVKNERKVKKNEKENDKESLFQTVLHLNEDKEVEQDQFDELVRSFQKQLDHLQHEFRQASLESKENDQNNLIDFSEYIANLLNTSQLNIEGNLLEIVRDGEILMKIPLQILSNNSSGQKQISAKKYSEIIVQSRLQPIQEESKPKARENCFCGIFGR